MENKQVTAVFEEIADRLELQGGNPFRVRSYRDAAQSIANLSERIEEMAEDGRLEHIPDIGHSTAEHIREILKTGSCKRLKELRKNTPRGLPELKGRRGQSLHSCSTPDIAILQGLTRPAYSSR